MPSYPCKWPTCTNYVTGKPGFCEQHADKRTPRQVTRAKRAQFYDQHVRDVDAKKFYDSKAWQVTRAAKLAADPICERCNREWARHVHHKKPLKECEPGERLAWWNLFSACPPCHNTIEAEARNVREDA